MATNSYKVLGQIAGTTSLTDLYSVPNGYMAFASVLAICNQSTTTATVRVAVRPAGQTIAAKHYILYDAYVNSSDTLNLTLGLSLGPLDVVSVSSSLTSVSAVLSGSELIIDGTTVASVYNIATAASVGMVRPDNTSISVTSGILSLVPGGSFTQATASTFGAVRPDNTSIVITSGVISAGIANASVLGIVKPDTTSITISNGVLSVPFGTAGISAGIVRADGTSILITSGLISANIQTGSSSTLGIVRADGTSILVTSGVISANVQDIRSAPQNQQTGAYILAATDAGKHISITTGGITVNASILTVGDMVTVYNSSNATQTITQGTNVTLRLAGTASTGSRTINQFGLATIFCVQGGSTPVFVVSGSGLL
jgi:hypothetical protein